MIQQKFRLFLSYPDSGHDLAAAIEAIVTKAVTNGPWKDYFKLDVCMWDHADRPVFLDAFSDPNGQIFSKNFPPSEADLFLVCLCDRIGDGTIHEVCERVRRGSAARSSIKIFLQDTPPSRLLPSYKAAQAAYDEMHEWLEAPFERVGDERCPLDCKKPFKIEVGSSEELFRNVELVLIEELRALHSARADSRRAMPAVDPYPGLTPLRTEHAEYIFGREKDIATIVKARDGGKRFLMVWGASGVGKSSLVQAGVIGGDHTARNVTMIPGREPARQLADALQQFVPGTTSFAIRHAPDEELSQLNAALANCPRLYVFVDQFERLYLTSAKEITDITRILVALARVPKCIVIITHRSDQMPEWARRPALSAPGEFEWSLHPVTDVRATYLRDVIEGPARKARKGLPERELVEQLIEDFDEQRNATPLLALTLHDLYEASGRGARPMALADYRAKGGLKGMLDERTRQLSYRLARYGFGDDRLLALFPLVVDFDHEGRAVTRAAPREDVVALFAAGTLDDPWEFVEQELVWQFFLRTEQTDASGAGALTLAHEVFYEEWPLLRKWIEDNKYQIQQIRELEREAQRWKINGSSPAYLLPRERLDTATTWLSEQPSRFRESVRHLASEFVARSDKYAKEKRVEEAIFRGEIREVDDLLKEGVKARAPISADTFTPFYDVIWGEPETDGSRASIGSLGGEDGPLNPQNAMLAVAHGFRPIHFAALAGRSDKILLLVSLGVNVNLPSAKGTTPLSCAAFAGRIEAVRLLLSLEADITIRNQENQLGPADWANERGHIEVVELLLNRLGDFSRNMPTEVSRGLILSAAQAADAGQLRRFLPRLGDGPERVPVLQEALALVASRSTECVLLLIAAGADPIRPDTGGFVPFHIAAALGDSATLTAMIGAIAPADMDARGRQGLTALGAVITGSGPDMNEKVTLLLAAGCDPSLAPAPGTKPLIAAAARGLTSIVEQLLARSDAILEATDEDGDTALMLAALMGHSGVVQLLLDSGADPRVANKTGRTALIHAASRGHEGIIQQLLACANALPAAADERGYTALMLAARSGSYPAVAMLLGSVDAQQVNAVDRIGWTALEHAAFEDQDHVLSLLLDHGARLPLWAELAHRDDGREDRHVSYRMDAERLSATIREALSPDLDAAWAVPPLIGLAEQWIVLDPSRAAILIEDLARSLAEGHQWINAGPITRLRTMAPPFYPGATLCEAETRTFDGAGGLILFIKTSEGCTLLDGTSRPIHKHNEMGQIDISAPENALQYTQFFCSATDGKLGPFEIVASRSELEYARDLTAREQYWTSALRVSPPTLPQLSEDPARWTLSASVSYGGLLFRSEFEVLTTGQVSMEDDKAQLEEPLPFRIWAFWGKVRQDRTAACNPSAA